MSLSSDILEVLVSAGCKDNLPNADAFNASLEEGLRSSLYRNIVAHLADELHQVYKTEERINKDSEINEFQMELSSFLKEMMCPFKEFVTGPMSDRFPTVESRLRLLEYLGSELMAARMCHVLNPTKSDQNVITINETQAAKSLKEITECLNVDNKTKATKELFNELNNQLEALLKKVGPNRTGKPLFAPTKPLTEKQWIELEEIQKDLDKDYGIRRELLLTRLDCTIQSFQWSDRLKNQGDAISEKYSAKRRQLDSLMKPGDETNIAALLAARDDLALIEKTACASVRVNTATRIQKHIIGQVPDRGGRADEVAPPPPEMPSWQKNRAQGGGGFGGGGGGGRGRGGGGEQRGRGGRGGGRGGGGAGGSAYEPNFQAKPQGNFQATLSYKPQGQYQNQGYQQQQQQPQQGHQQNNQQQGYQGGRVQGGWSQKGYNRPSSGGNDDEDNRGGNGYQGQGGQQQRRGRGRGGGQRY